jgi:metal-responsive CopG/Arc/MetJ family transcriptional regulator
MRKSLTITLPEELLKLLEENYTNKSRLLEALIRKHLSEHKSSSVNQEEEFNKILGL